MKRLKVTVKPGGDVIVSGPPGVSMSEIERMLDKHDGWIKDTVARMRTKTPEPVTSGSHITLLGRKVEVRLCSGGVTHLDNDVLYLRADENSLEARLEQFLNKFAVTQFEQSFRRVWRLMEHLNVPMPRITVREMKTRWGSCTPDAHTIRINRHLIKAEPIYHDLVMAHEMCHFLHRGHGQDFHSELERIIPGHRRLQKQLDALGLLNIS